MEASGAHRELRAQHDVRRATIESKERERVTVDGKKRYEGRKEEEDPATVQGLSCYRTGTLPCYIDLPLLTMRAPRSPFSTHHVEQKATL